MTKRRRNNGFTLLEVMAVATLVALLFSVSISSYSRTFKRWAVEQNARQLYMAAKSARLYAIEHQQECTLVLDMANRQFFLMLKEEDSEVDLVSRPWSRKIQLQPHVELETVKIDGQYENQKSGIVFRRDGTADTAAIQLGNGQVHYTVMINGGTSRARLTEGQVEELRTDQIDLDLNDEV